MLSDRIGIMKDGKLLATGTATELCEKTKAHNFESAFVAIIRGENIEVKSMKEKI